MYSDYSEETIYDKSYEHLWGQKVGVKLELTQPWGELDTGIDFSNYFHDFRYYKVDMEFDISIRLTKYISFKVEIDAESIHDQLYLPKEGASRDDILLKRQRLETDFDIQTQIGLRFTFGSIYNTIVNERM